MDSLSGLIAFVRTAETLSFVAAGRLLGVSASAVGKNVARLEQSVGVRLFQRSTRRVSLTNEGALFYERCRRVLDELRDAEAMLSQSALVPRGRLRVSLPTIGYRFLMPILPEFSARYPEVELDLDFDDRILDVIEEGLDVVVRSGELADSRLMSRRLGAFRFVLCASPAYLAAHGEPRTPGDLAQHKCLRFRFPTTGKLQDWSLRHEAGAGEPRIPVTMVCNNIEALRAAAIGGMGIVHMPDFLVRDAIALGSLRTVLDGDMINPGQFWALWPSSRQLSPRLRVFVDFLSERLFVSQLVHVAGNTVPQ
ncbi:LysR family transcriptional regulator [Bradyrhizobium prioriisuperbiae]|uniref:LysR family transcriptional regulator n=1 Tax=Bradyrhizobium prioriisuperbiae TaxID=2854389 RepID=UPI0028EF32B4|nr:LysR family transcriptional regulator [Bradyrhizobium prioritasuperba]